MASKFFLDSASIREVICLKTGATMACEEYIPDDEFKLFSLRHEILVALQNQAPIAVCANCGNPIRLISIKKNRKYFFRHIYEDGKCPYITKGALSQLQINAIRYHGQKEGPDHKRTKDLTIRSLTCDPDFSHIQTETTWVNSEKQRRRPDIQCKHKNTTLAFEVQISNTYVDVIIARRQFFLKEGALLVWILKELPSSQRRMTVDDTFHINNCNALIVDQETLAISESYRKFYIRCVWQVPDLSGATIVNTIEQAILPFDSLTPDIENQRAYHFDYKSAYAEVERELSIQTKNALIKHFTNELASLAESRHQYTDTNRTWSEIRDKYSELPHLPKSFYQDKFDKLVSFIYTAINGKPTGYGSSSLVDVLNKAFANQKDLLILLISALHTYDHYTKQKQYPSWAERSNFLIASLDDTNFPFIPLRKWDLFVQLYFPDIYRTYEKYLNKISNQHE